MEQPDGLHLWCRIPSRFNGVKHHTETRVLTTRARQPPFECRRQEQINIATGEREAFIARSEGEKQAVINKAQGDAQSILAVAEATGQAIKRIALAIRQPRAEQAVQLKVAEKAVEAYSRVASDATTTTLIVHSNMTEVSA